MDSGLETFIKSRPKKPLNTPARRKQEKAYLKADQLINDMLDRREKLERRSAFFHQGVPKAVGSAPIPDPDERDFLGRERHSEAAKASRMPQSIYRLVDSELPKIAPGLIPDRLKKIKELAPRETDLLHARVGRMLDTLEERPRPSRAPTAHSSRTSHGGDTDIVERDMAALRLGAPGDRSKYHTRHLEHRAEMIKRGVDPKIATTIVNEHITKGKRLPSFPSEGVPRYEHARYKAPGTPRAKAGTAGRVPPTPSVPPTPGGARASTD